MSHSEEQRDKRFLEALKDISSQLKEIKTSLSPLVVERRTTEEVRWCLLALVKAIERVTVNTYVEQGAVPADEVFKILGQIEDVLTGRSHNDG